MVDLFFLYPRGPKGSRVYGYNMPIFFSNRITPFFIRGFDWNRFVKKILATSKNMQHVTISNNILNTQSELDCLSVSVHHRVRRAVKLAFTKNDRVQQEKVLTNWAMFQMGRWISRLLHDRGSYHLISQRSQVRRHARKMMSRGAWYITVWFSAVKLTTFTLEQQHAPPYHPNNQVVTQNKHSNKHDNVQNIPNDGLPLRITSLNLS